jgi:hypothetical protein
MDTSRERKYKFKLPTLDANEEKVSACFISFFTGYPLHKRLVGHKFGLDPVAKKKVLLLSWY